MIEEYDSDAVKSLLQGWQRIWGAVANRSGECYQGKRFWVALTRSSLIKVTKPPTCHVLPCLAMLIWPLRNFPWTPLTFPQEQKKNIGFCFSSLAAKQAHVARIMPGPCLAAPHVRLQFPVADPAQGARPLATNI